jgi:L-fucose isomerase-like protein
VLWTLREPVIDGGRLRLNSLTGAYSAANMLKSFGRPFTYIFGSPKEESVQRKLEAAINAARLKGAMRELNLLQVGHTPQGFGFGRGLDAEMAATFGTNLISIEARELIDKAKAFTDDDVADYLADARGRIKALDSIKEKKCWILQGFTGHMQNTLRTTTSARFQAAAGPISSPAFGTPVCAALAMLNDLGIAASCEADTYGAFLCLPANI